MRALLGLLIGSATLGFATPAHAWEIESLATTGCHERITLNALAAAGWPDGEAPPPPTETERRIIADVPFSFPLASTRTGWHVALLLGVRNNDVGDKDPTDLAALSSIHNDPNKQDEHCLRNREDDDAPGNASARERCKAFVLEELAQALGDGDDLDLEARVEVSTTLKFRGNLDLSLQRFAFHVGRALHGLQDGYTHTFRNPDTGEIRTVLNWIEGNIGSSYDEARDGHEHVGQLDDCTRTDAVSRGRERRATEASTALLAAIADPAGGRAGRLARAGAALDAALAEEPDCTIDNDYCDAPELTIAGCCGAGGGDISLAIPGLLVGLALWGRGRRGVLLAAATAVALLPALAHADEVGAEAPKSDTAEEKQLAREDKVIEALPDPTTQPWGLAVSGGGAFDRAGFAVSAGARWNPTERLGFGLDVEYNPWLSLSEIDIVPGSLNVYVPIILKLRKFGSWELRSTFAVGASMLLFDLVEADKGSIGVYAGWNPLGIAVSVGANFKLVIKPGDIAVPVPEVIGFPFYYHQYRFTVGLEWYP